MLRPTPYDPACGDLDQDNDGSNISDDCDDNDPTVFAGTPEVCDDKDNDCDAITPDSFDGPGLGTGCYGIDSDLCIEGVLECTDVNNCGGCGNMCAGGDTCQSGACVSGP